MKHSPSVGRFQCRFRFRIAGVVLSVSSIRNIRLRQGTPLYRSFKASGIPRAGDHVIDIRVHVEQSPPSVKMERAFDTRESWSMFHSKGHRWIVFRSMRYADPFWIAGFDRRVSRVEYFCPPTHPASCQRMEEFSSPLNHPLDQLLLMYFFARRQGILTHSAGVILNGKAYLFAGASGAGKSTFSQLLVQARVGKMLSDERMIVRDIKGETIAFGTPWAGTAGIARNGSAPLAGIFFLMHGKSNQIERIDPAAAADRLLPMISIPWYDMDTAAPIIASAKRLTSRVPAYEFRFSPDRTATGCFKEFLKTETDPGQRAGSQRQKAKGKRQK